MHLDCDVLQADGGTRTAAITGAWVALHQAFSRLVEHGSLQTLPFRCAVAAISVGLHDGNLLLDLDYSEDSAAQADFNIVMTDAGAVVEIQGTAEGEPFPRQKVTEALTLASRGIEQLFAEQRGQWGDGGRGAPNRERIRFGIWEYSIRRKLHSKRTFTFPAPRRRLGWWFRTRSARA